MRMRKPWRLVWRSCRPRSQPRLRSSAFKEAFARRACKDADDLKRKL
jgi:hypothetical protein